MSDIDLGQSVRDVIAEAERRQAIYGTLAQNLRAIFPAAAMPAVEASAIESAHPRARRLLSTGRRKTLGRRQGASRKRQQRKGLAGVDVEDLLARVTVQLKLGPCRVSDLASALRIDSRRTKLALNMMQRAGVVVVKGFSRGARWSLKKTTPAARMPPAPVGEPRTLAEAVGGQSKPTVSTGGTSRAGMASPARADVVQRDAAILAQLRKGPATVGDLRKVMPKEADLDDEQQERACSNALSRLRLKGQIKATDDGWALA
jgi:hypothetical protein